MIKDLIEVKQLPVIEEQLRSVSTVIEERVKNATNLVCTEESVKTIKEIRAELNKDYKEFETKRKLVKEQVLKPYNDFENVYKMLYVLVEGEQKGEYELDPDFATQWLNPNSNLRESIFEIQYVTNGKNWDESTGWNGVWFIPSSDGGYGFHLPTQHLLDAFDPEDPRITWTFVRQGDQFVGNDFVTGDANYPSRFFDRKHFVPMSETLNAASPVYPQDVEMTVYVIRYADVLLMYAEACLEKGNIVGARKYLNQVRKRARESSPLDAKRVIQKYVPDTKPTSLPDITSDNVAEVRLAIWNERRFEFACEGIRRMDLMQQERYGEIMTAVYSNGYATEDVDKGRYYTKERELFPIPQI